MKTLKYLCVFFVSTLFLLVFSHLNNQAYADITITEFLVPTDYSVPENITSGPDGNVWFTEYGGNKIGRITPGGTITEFPVTTANSGLFGITSGPDGNLWFTENNGNKIGRITPGGTITEFAIPTAWSRALDITSGNDGNLWFTENNGNKIGRITPGGTITEFTIPTDDSYSHGITSGPDGNVWFTERGGNKIGRVNLAINLKPTPFLDLPWNYKAGYKSFFQQAFNPESWFDHEYPLQNITCCVHSVLMYDGIQREVAYRSHSGYDYSLRNGVGYKTPVLAAAEGIATFIPEAVSEGYGNLIKIDHGNGYQTWYGHLDLLNHIFATGAAELRVNKGDKIGEAGYTGNVYPKNQYGAHIHFSVFKDANSNDNFNDDKPYGLVDPLGWKPDSKFALKTDPWTQWGSGVRHGAASYNLFTERQPPVEKIIKPDEGGIIANEKAITTILQNSFSKDLKVIMDNGPFEYQGNALVSIVPSLIITINSLIGDFTDIFSPLATITYNYNEADLTNINQDSIKLYYLNEDSGIWESLTTKSHDQSGRIITAETNHFSRFALMGMPKDKIAPETEIIIQGDRGQNNLYRSSISLELSGKDNEGGLGAADTLYTLDGKDWQYYTTPLSFENEGTYTITYQSRDNANNLEDQKSATFYIDKTPPEADIKYDLATFDTQVIGKDGAGSTNITVDKTAPLHPKYKITDQAGNMLLLNTDKIKLGKQVALSIKSMQYNSDPITNLDKNVFFTLVLADKNNTPKQIDQYYSQKDDKKIFTNYLASSGITKIFTKIPGVSTYTREDKTGIILVQISTENGKLKYSY